MSQVICNRCGEEIVYRWNLYVIPKGWADVIAFHHDCYGLEVLDGHYTGYYGSPLPPINGIDRRKNPKRPIWITLIVLGINLLLILILSLISGQNMFISMILFPPGAILLLLPTLISAIWAFFHMPQMKKSWDLFERYLDAEQ